MSEKYSLNLDSTERPQPREQIEKFLKAGYVATEQDTPELHDFADGTQRMVYKTVLAQGQVKRKVFYSEVPLW